MCATDCFQTKRWDWFVLPVQCLVTTVPSAMYCEIETMIWTIVEAVMAMYIVSMHFLQSCHRPILLELFHMCLCEPCPPEVLLLIVVPLCRNEAVSLDWPGVANCRKCLELLCR
eukprot:297513-Amphidinium_carterae.3